MVGLPSGIGVKVGWKSIILQGLPFFFAHKTIRWHHVMGSPMGTTSMTPRQTSLSRSALISFCQWISTGIGKWYAVGLAAGSIINFMGGPSIMGSGWCSHVLNVLDL